jgi:hypothetical protein
MAYIPMPRLNSRPPGARDSTSRDRDLQGGKKGKYYRYELTFYFDYTAEAVYDQRAFEVRMRFSVPLGASPILEEWRLHSLAEDKLIDLGILVDRENWGFRSEGYRPRGKSNTTAIIYKIAEKASTGFQFPKDRSWGILNQPRTVLLHHQVRRKFLAYNKKQRQQQRVNSISRKYRVRH